MEEEMSEKRIAQQPKTALVTGCDAIRTNVLAQRDAGIPWRKIAANLGVKPGTLCRWAKNGWEPKDNTIRAKLGLPPVLVLAPPCPNCGKAHPPKPCRIDKMAPEVRKEVNKFIDWAIGRGYTICPVSSGAVYDKHGRVVTK
jgi:hypothetical protein